MSKILEGEPTNSRGEMLAVIEAIKMSDPACPLLIVTDSLYVIKGNFLNFYFEVVSRIRKKVINDLDNLDLVKELAAFLSDRISFEHVLKSSKSPGNIAADELARNASKRAIEKLQLKGKF